MTKIKNKSMKAIFSILLVATLFLNSFPLHILANATEAVSENTEAVSTNSVESISFQKFENDQWTNLNGEWQLTNPYEGTFKLKAVIPESQREGTRLRVIQPQANKANEQVIEQVSLDNDEKVIEFRVLQQGTATIELQNRADNKLQQQVIKIVDTPNKATSLKLQRFKHGDGSGIHPTWRDLDDNSFLISSYEEVKKGKTYAIRAVAIGEEGRIEFTKGENLIRKFDSANAVVDSQLNQYNNGTEVAFEIIGSGEIEITATAGEMTKKVAFTVAQDEEEKVVFVKKDGKNSKSPRNDFYDIEPLTEEGLQLNLTDEVCILFSGLKADYFAKKPLRNLTVNYSITEGDSDVVEVERAKGGYKYDRVLNYVFNIIPKKPGSVKITFSCEVDGKRYERVLPVVVRGSEDNQPSTEESTTKAAQDIVINGAVERMRVNEEVQLSATLTPSDTTDTLQWSVENQEFGTITENGKFTAIKAGVAKVIATAGSVSKNVTINIEENIVLNSLKYHKRASSGYARFEDVQNDAIDVIVGQGAYIKAQASSGEIQIEAKENSAGFIRVSQSDVNNEISRDAIVVTATKAGEHQVDIKVGSNVLKTITIRAEEKTPQVKFAKYQHAGVTGSSPTYMPSSVGKYYGNNSDVQMKIGDWFALLPNVDGVEEAFSYEFDLQGTDGLFEKTRTTNRELHIKALKAGEATLKVKTVSGETTLRLIVADQRATSVSINNAPTEMLPKTQIKLSARVEPRDTTDKITWSTDSNEFATISEDGTLSALKPGTVKVIATAGDQRSEVSILIKNESAPRIYFKNAQGEKVYVTDGEISLKVTDSGTFHMDGEEEKTVMPVKWNSEEKVTQSEYVGQSFFWYWIDQTNRFHPRKQGEMPIEVDYFQNGQKFRTKFTLKVIPSGIEEIRAYVMRDGERFNLSMVNPIVVSGSERTWIEVEGRLSGQEEFKKLPDTAYAIKYKYNQHIIGSSFALWKPGEHTLDVRMLDDYNVNTSFKANSSYVKGTGIGGEIPTRWPIHDWNNLGKKFVGMRSYDHYQEMTKGMGHTLHTLPRNASYHNLVWESHTPEIAEFDPLHENGLVPKKPGVARFTVRVYDNPEVSKEVEVEFYYKNPLETASVPTTEVNKTMKVGSSEIVNLLITPMYASEQRFNWTYEGDGAVVMKDTVHVDPSDVNVEKWTVHELRAIKPGRVTVTGTPYDTTGDVSRKTVVFTVDVVTQDQQKQINDLDSILSSLKERMENIKSSYENTDISKDLWKIAELGKFDSERKLENIKNIEKTLFTENKELTKNPGDLAKAILALRASNIDPERYYGYNLVESLIKLKKEAENRGVYAYAPYMYAISSDSYSVPNIEQEKEEAVEKILAMRSENGLWGDYLDGTGFALYALAPYYSQKEVKNAVEKVVDELSKSHLKGDADINDNSNTLSMVLGGLASCNISYMTDSRLISNGKTMLHALESYKDSSNTDFYWQKANEEGKDLATEQAFRALISYFKGYVFDYKDLPKNAIGTVDVETLQAGLLLTSEIERAKNILESEEKYEKAGIDALKQKLEEITNILKDILNNKAELDSKANELSDLIGKLVKKSDSTTVHNSNEIEVTFELNGENEEVWIPKTKYNVEKNSTVYTVFDKALKENNIVYEKKGNYISKIKSPITKEFLAEFSRGQNSGWMYKVNGVHVNKGLEQHILHHGDYVLWHYTKDYKKEPSYFSGGGFSANTTTQQTAQVAKTETKVVKLSDVKSDAWYSEAVNHLVAEGILSGKGDGNFHPNDNITRAEFITILKNLSKDMRKNSVSLKDVKEGAWYEDAIAWAVANNIATGADGKFNPSANITREEMAVMIERFAQLYNVLKLENKESAKTFKDSSDIASWAKSSVEKLQKAGVIKGKENGNFEPKESSTRAEAAQIIYMALAK